MGKSVQVHKTRFASKASRHIHRTSQTDKARISKEQKQHVGGKGARAARIQRNKMARDQKRAASLKDKRASGGPSSPPRVILLFGISDKVNLKPLEEELVKLLVPEVSDHVSTTVSSPDYKLRITILIAPWGDLLAWMEMIKVADRIAFVAPGSSVYETSESGGFVDSFGGQCFSIMRTIGFPSTAVLIR